MSCRSQHTPKGSMCGMLPWPKLATGPNIWLPVHQGASQASGAQGPNKTSSSMLWSSEMPHEALAATACGYRCAEAGASTQEASSDPKGGTA